jgi:thiol-disulfide isomerase/thioredoxin
MRLEPEVSRDGDPAGLLWATTGPDLAGTSQPLSQWRGKVVAVNFWATWCPPCREEIPELVRIQQSLGPSGVQIVGVAVDEKAKVAAFAEKAGINFPTLLLEYGGIELSRRTGNRAGGLPYTVVLDRQGRIAHVELGAIRIAAFEGLLKSLAAA